MRSIVLSLIMGFSFVLAETYTVYAGSMYYNPNTLSIEQGDSVEFINEGGFHDVEVVSGPESFSLSPCSGPCTIGTLTFNNPGTYDYICSISNHEQMGMTGTITVNAQTTASVQVIHNSASPTVDVYIDGALAVENFEYRTSTPVLELPTSFTVGIAPVDGDVIAEFPFDLMDGGEYVVVATGLLGDATTPFDLAAAGTTFGASEGFVGLNVYHGSTDAPSVDVLADGAVLVSDLMYGSFSGYVEVPEADYTIGVAPTGGESIADFTAPLAGLGGNSAVVFASGFLSGDDPAFGLFAALEDGVVIELPSYSNLSNSNILNKSFEITSLYPNPFNPTTTLTFQVPELTNINVDIYNINGQFVESLYSGFKNPGQHSINWNASNVSTGVYLIRMSSGSYVETSKVMLLK